ncbi:MAG TPA: 2-amino-4-hydroxy-6-hydroxymethyldihydropteridine diphosphokinase [Myxococcota bacterium]
MDGAPIEEQVFVAMGSNLGDRDAHLAAGLARLRATKGIEVVAVSPLYETEPVGPAPQGLYLNGAIQLATTLHPKALLDRLLEIEIAEGRNRGVDRNAPRTLDLDLLLYGGRKLAGPDLEIPHPRLAERPFVLEPLCDLAAEFVHPVLGETIAVLARRVRDPAAVRRRNSSIRL